MHLNDWSQFVQIDCICEALYRAKDGKKLAQLFAGNDYNLMLYHCQHSNVVIRAYLYMLFYCQRFEEFFQVNPSSFSTEKASIISCCKDNEA